MANNITTHEDWKEADSQIPSFATALVVGSASVAIIVNLIFTVVSTRVLQKSFHNLFVICLCANDGIMGFAGLVFFLTAALIKSPTVCIIILMSVTYCMNCSILIIFLVAFIRYQNIVRRNLHMCWLFERYKYYITAGAHILALATSVCSILSAQPFDSVITDRCSAHHIFQEKFYIYAIVGYCPSTILAVAVILMYVVSCYRVWKNLNVIFPVQIETQIQKDDTGNDESVISQTSKQDDAPNKVASMTQGKRKPGSSQVHGKEFTGQDQKQIKPESLPAYDVTCQEQGITNSSLVHDVTCQEQGILNLPLVHDVTSQEQGILHSSLAHDVPRQRQGILNSSLVHDVTRQEQGILNSSLVHDVTCQEQGILNSSLAHDVTCQEQGILNSSLAHDVTCQEQGILNSSLARDVTCQEQGILNSSLVHDVTRQEQGILNSSLAHDVTCQEQGILNSSLSHDVTCQEQGILNSSLAHEVTCQEQGILNSSLAHDVTCQEQGILNPSLAHDVTCQEQGILNPSLAHDVTCQEQGILNSSLTHDVTCQKQGILNSSLAHDVTCQEQGILNSSLTHDVTCQEQRILNSSLTHDVTCQEQRIPNSSLGLNVVRQEQQIPNSSLALDFACEEQRILDASPVLHQEIIVSSLSLDSLHVIPHQKNDSDTANQTKMHPQIRTTNVDVQKNKCDSLVYQRRVLVTGLIVAGTTICLNAPLLLSFWYDIFFTDGLKLEFRFVVFIFNMINAILDPFIYAWRVPQIRNQLKSIRLPCLK